MMFSTCRIILLCERRVCDNETRIRFFRILLDFGDFFRLSSTSWRLRRMPSNDHLLSSLSSYSKTPSTGLRCSCAPNAIYSRLAVTVVLVRLARSRCPDSLIAEYLFFIQTPTIIFYNFSQAQVQPVGIIFF